MTEESYIPNELQEELCALGFDTGGEKATHQRVFKWMKEKFGVYPNILSCLERNGDVKYYLKSVIQKNVELSFKKRKFDTYEECAEYTILMLTV
jgi:hypothetical protein